ATSPAMSSAIDVVARSKGRIQEDWAVCRSWLTRMIAAPPVAEVPSAKRTSVSALPKGGGLFFDPSDDAVFRRALGKATQLLDPGWAGHVDLDELASDEIQPHEPQPVLAEYRCELSDQLLLFCRQLGAFDLSAHVDVGAEIVVAGDAQDGAQGRAV